MRLKGTRSSMGLNKLLKQRSFPAIWLLVVLSASCATTEEGAASPQGRPGADASAAGSQGTGSGATGGFGGTSGAGGASGATGGSGGDTVCNASFCPTNG